MAVLNMVLVLQNPDYSLSGYKWPMVADKFMRTSLDPMVRVRVLVDSLDDNINVF